MVNGAQSPPYTLISSIQALKVIIFDHGWLLVRVLRELEEDFTHYHYKGYMPIRSLSFIVLNVASVASTPSWWTSTKLWTPPPTL